MEGSFALTLGGLVFSGFSDSAGASDTTLAVVALINASGVSL